MFSVLVSAYQTEAFIAEMVRSVIAQERDDWELVVVDNGSPDALAEVVTSCTDDPRIRLVRLPTNIGVSAARNVAARHARGKIFCVIDSDDALVPEYLNQIAAAYTAHPEAGLVGCRPARIDAHGRSLPQPPGVPRPITWDEREPVLLHLLRGPFDYHGAAITRNAFETVGGYREELTIGEDADLWIRIVASGHHVRAIEAPLYRYRIHSKSITANPDNAITVAAGQLATLQALASSLPMTPTRRAALDANERRTRNAMSLAQMRQAVRNGDAPLARRESRRVATGKPSIRNLAVMTPLTLPWPLVRLVYRATRRGHLVNQSKSPRR